MAKLRSRVHWEEALKNARETGSDYGSEFDTEEEEEAAVLLAEVEAETYSHQDQIFVLESIEDHEPAKNVLQLPRSRIPTQTLLREASPVAFGGKTPQASWIPSATAPTTMHSRFLGWEPSDEFEYSAFSRKSFYGKCLVRLKPNKADY